MDFDDPAVFIDRGAGTHDYRKRQPLDFARRPTCGANLLAHFIVANGRARFVARGV